MDGRQENWIANPSGKWFARMTKLRFTRILRTHVLPVIGNLKLAGLQPADVERVLNRMRASTPTGRTATTP